MAYIDPTTGKSWPSREWKEAQERITARGEAITTSGIRKEMGGTLAPEPKAPTEPVKPDIVQVGPITPPTKPIESEVPAEDLGVGTAVDEGEVPTGGGADQTEALIKGMQADLDAAIKRAQEAEQKRLDDLQKQKEEQEKRIADLETKQEVMLEEKIEPLLEPFKEKLEKTERERLKLEEQYFANVQAATELQNLLTTGQAEIEAIRDTPGLEVIKTGQINKKVEDISAKASILQAVISVRRGNIADGKDFIDRTVTAIEEDRKAQLDYYDRVWDFYETKKDTAGKKLITLEKDEKDYIQQKIDDLKAQVEIDRAAVDRIKELLTDPQWAEFLQSAGIKVTDSVEEINTKIAEETNKRNLQEKLNQMEADNYERLMPGQEIQYTEDQLERWTNPATGKEYVFKRPVEEKKLTITEQEQQAVADMSAQLRSVVGADGYVSPDDFKFARSAWQARGLSVSDFDKEFANFVNPTHAQDYFIKEELEAVEEERKQFLTPEYIKDSFDEDALKKAATDAGYAKGGLKWVPWSEARIGGTVDIDKYIQEELMPIIERMRTAGYSDQDIFEGLTSE